MSERINLANIPVTALSGVGKVKASAYEKAGVFNLLDLLYYFPRAYEDRGDIRLLAETLPEGKSAVVLTVGTEPKIANIKRGMSLLKFRAFDESGVCEVTYFNQNYFKDKFPVGSTFRFYGRFEKVKTRYTVSSPAAEPWVDELPPRSFFSVYRLSEGLSQKQISQNVEAALELAKNDLDDPIPKEIRERHGLCSIYEALSSIHFPEDYQALSRAKRRLIFDEFFLFASGITLSGNKLQRPTALPCPDTDISPLLSLLPYKLTDAQSRTVSEIARDMQKSEQMSRIVIGDVGCGKTICAAAAIYIAVKNGRQAALMAPTEILAVQHYNELSRLFSALGIKTSLLIGSLTPTAKKKIHYAMQAEDRDERVDVVIGTQALLSDGAYLIDPGLVVTDEQHRFGVNQRALLSEKNKHTHILVMSATPIPRSLALVMYGDLDVSKIDEMPPGRQRVDTFVVDESYRERLDGFICKNVDAGGQVYIVCPAVEESDEGETGEIDLSEIALYGEELQRSKKPPLKAAVQYAEELASRLRGYNIAFVHGKMKPAEKDSVMSRFASGEIQILVSTTVIEVGVNVPSACLMIVENAERFGLSQLHQLRGRVGRGSTKSYCVLVNGIGGKLGETAKQRLSTMSNSYNGFEIAEEDLKLRGPGDFLALSANSSIRQSGSLTFKLADMCSDCELMQSAFAEAKAYLEKDPKLEKYPPLRAASERMFTVRKDIIN